MDRPPVMPDRIQIFTESSAIAARSVAVEANLLADRKLHIDTHDWPRGVYYFHVVSDRGQRVEKVRVVLE